MATLAVTKRRETYEGGRRLVTGLLAAGTGTPTADDFMTGLNHVDNVLLACVNATEHAAVTYNVDAAGASKPGWCKIVAGSGARAFRFLAEGT